MDTPDRLLVLPPAVAVTVAVVVVLISMMSMVRMGQRVRRTDDALRRTNDALRRIEEEVRYEIPPSRRKVIEGSILTVMRRVGTKSEPCGVAFFVSATCALTAAHTLEDGLKRVTCVLPSNRGKLEFDVVARDGMLDFAVLKLRPGHPVSSSFLKMPSPGDPPASGEVSVFLVTCHFAMTAEATNVNALGISWHKARVIRYHDHHFMYDAQAFNGDAGGAIVVARTGEMLGLHQELINHARELIEQAEGLDEELDAMQVSIKSLIQGTSFGCLGLRMDLTEVKTALVAAASASTTA